MDAPRGGPAPAAPSTRPGSTGRPACASPEENALDAETATRSDLYTAIALSRDYIASVQGGDVRRFNEVPAGDFLCSNPDGSLVDEAALPARTARPAPVRGLAAKDAKARVLVDIAIVHARTSYTLADGERRNGRCADVWARRGGRWLAVAAHVTPRRPRPEERRFSPSSPTRAGPAASS